MFIAVLFVIIMNWKWPKCPSAGGWINKWWHTLTITKMVLGNKKNEQLMHKTTLLNSKHVTLGQVLSICSAQAQSSSPSTLNKALLGSSHTHSFPCFSCLPWCYSSRSKGWETRTTKPKTLLLSSLHKTSSNLCVKGKNKRAQKRYTLYDFNWVKYKNRPQLTHIN